jgi:hypothetical protein
MIRYESWDSVLRCQVESSLQKGTAFTLIDYV